MLNMRNIKLLRKSDIDVDGALTLLGDMEMYDEILQDFLEECEERILKIEEYYQKKDMENYAILVHALKGDSKYLGFTKLAEMSLEHQLKSQNSEVKYIEEHYEEFVKEINRILDIVREYLND